jgi:ribosome-associated protein
VEQTSAGPAPRPADQGNGLAVGQRFVIPAHELQWRFSASGGPGGQHVNTSNTRAELTFDIARSSVLRPWHRATLTEHYGDALRVVASDERSQSRNRVLAMQRLAARLDEALRDQRPRRPTKPTQAARRRRLETKQHRSQLKQSRRSGHPED